MLRPFLCLSVAFVLFAGVAAAADPAKKKKKQAAAGISGEIVKVDVEKGTVTVKVPGNKKTPAEEKEFKVTPETAVAILTELKADKVADLLKKEPFKPGTTVKIEAGEDGAARSVTLGGAGPTAKKKKKVK
jgi:hypothetical protein